jgi:hypothetical protein
MPMSRSEIGNHFFASSVLKSRYEIRPAALQDEIAITQTMAWKVSMQVATYLAGRTYLNSQQEEVEIVFGEREDVLVGDGHENGGATITKDR